MTLDEALEAFAQLLDEHAEAQRDPGPGGDNFRCVECRGCYDCRFCVSCLRCEECTYCEGCEDCSGCTQCKTSKGCTGCTHCEDCRDCSDSHYLTLCIDCEECVQCFACVGLSGEEFCLLNERYSRKEYFELAGKLREALDERMATGWRPPGVELDGDGSSTREVEERSAWDESAPAAAAGPSLTRGVRPARPGGRPGGSLTAPRRPERGDD